MNKVPSTRFLGAGWPTAWVIEPSLARPRGTYGQCIRCGDAERTAMVAGAMHHCFACGFSWHVSAGWPPTLAEGMVDLSGEVWVHHAPAEMPDCSACGGHFYKQVDSVRVRTEHGLAFKLQCTTCGDVSQVILSE